MCAGVVHVCQRWGNIILGLAYYLDLCLVCTFRTPIGDMLAHSPSLPLIIDQKGTDGTFVAEEGVVLALNRPGPLHPPLYACFEATEALHGH